LMAPLVPPQPIVAPIKVAINSRPSCVSFLRRRMGNPKNSRDAMEIAGPPIAMLRGGCWLRVTECPVAAVDGAVVLTVSVAVTAAVPTIAGGVVTEHVGASAPPAGPPVMAQLRVTLPVKLPLGVIVIVDVPFVSGDSMVTAVLFSVKPGGAAGTVAGTLTVKLVVASRLPAEAAVTVTV
jgi:hypothetical protein